MSSGDASIAAATAAAMVVSSAFPVALLLLPKLLLLPPVSLLLLGLSFPFRSLLSEPLLQTTTVTSSYQHSSRITAVIAIFIVCICVHIKRVLWLTLIWCWASLLLVWRESWTHRSHSVEHVSSIGEP